MNNRYDLDRRAQRERAPEFYFAPGAVTGYRRQGRWRFYVAVAIVAALLGSLPLLAARMLVLALWGGV